MIIHRIAVIVWENSFIYIIYILLWDLIVFSNQTHQKIAEPNPNRNSMPHVWADGFYLGLLRVFNNFETTDWL